MPSPYSRLTLEHSRRANFEPANAVRSARARVKRDLKAGKITLADVLADPPEHTEAMYVLDLLMVLPRRVRHRTLESFARCSVSLPLEVTIGDLPYTQRAAVVDALDGLA